MPNGWVHPDNEFPAISLLITGKFEAAYGFDGRNPYRFSGVKVHLSQE